MRLRLGDPETAKLFVISLFAIALFLIPSQKVGAPVSSAIQPQDANRPPALVLPVLQPMPRAEATPESSKIQQFIEKAKTDPTVWLTLALFTVACIQARIYTRQLQTSQTIERGYVSVSHAPPGLDVVAPVKVAQGVFRHDMRVVFKIENGGNTPIIVARAVFFVNVGPLPSELDYPHEHASFEDRAVLMKGDFIHMHSVEMSAQLETPSAGPFPQAVQAFYGSDPIRRRIYVTGYVIYRNAFRQWRRRGYGRVYDPQMDIDRANDPQRSNLLYNGLPKHNYDIEIPGMPRWWEFWKERPTYCREGD